MVNEYLNPYDTQVGYENVDIVYWDGSGYTATTTLQGAWYFQRPAPAPKPTEEPVTVPSPEPSPEPSAEPFPGTEPTEPTEPPVVIVSPDVKPTPPENTDTVLVGGIG